MSNKASEFYKAQFGNPELPDSHYDGLFSAIPVTPIIAPGGPFTLIPQGSPMTSDKELLELAAKAAGGRILGWMATGYARVAWTNKPGEPGADWNPLADDGDALRLAVKVGIFVDPDGSDLNEFVRAGCQGFEILEPYSQYPYAATRRAVTRAAAKIGRAMT